MYLLVMYWYVFVHSDVALPACHALLPICCVAVVCALGDLCHILALLPRYMLHCCFWCAVAYRLIACILCLMVICYVIVVCALLLRYYL